MVQDNWRRQEEGAEDSQYFEDIDPLASLACELALCIDAVEHSIGTFCSSCSCDLGFHLPNAAMECEFCGCDEIHKLCTSCGKSRAVEHYEVGSPVCKYCRAIPPVRIKPIRQPSRPPRDDIESLIVSWSETAIEDDLNRSKAAKMVLKGLDE